MLTFLELYQTLLGFVFFKLYTDIGLVYPPPLDLNKQDSAAGIGAFTLEESARNNLLSTLPHRLSRKTTTRRSPVRPFGRRSRPSHDLASRRDMALMFPCIMMVRKIETKSFRYGPQHQILGMQLTFLLCIPYHLFRKQVSHSFSLLIHFSCQEKRPDPSSSPLCGALVAGSDGLAHRGVGPPSTRLMTQLPMSSSTVRRLNDSTKERPSDALGNDENMFNHSGLWTVSTAEIFCWKSLTCKARLYHHI